MIGYSESIIIVTNAKYINFSKLWTPRFATTD